jgi:hypothetical protein
MYECSGAYMWQMHIFLMSVELGVVVRCVCHVSAAIQGLFLVLCAGMRSTAVGPCGHYGELK